jgi:REP element-mobilizing transposase RayT
MARPLRIEYPGAFYHVLNRGERREPIVRGSQDRERFVSDLSKLAKQYGVQIHGYCLMTNHYHLLLETPHANLSQAMQWLNAAYAAYYNRRHRCCGHLFQGRFNAILIEAGTHLEAVSRYIHLNPVRAGLASDAWTYPWSSCRYFAGPDRAPDWLETRRILGGFARTLGAARRRYMEYLAEPAGNPLAGVVAGSILGSATFTEWVKDTYLSGRIADPESRSKSRARPSVKTPKWWLHHGAALEIPRAGNAIGAGISRSPVAEPGSPPHPTLVGGIEMAVTMRCKDVRRVAADRQLAKDLNRLRRTLRIMNN